MSYVRVEVEVRETWSGSNNRIYTCITYFIGCKKYIYFFKACYLTDFEADLFWGGALSPWLATCGKKFNYGQVHLLASVISSWMVENLEQVCK